MADTVAILGGGKIGEALLSGLLRGARGPQDIVVSERYPQRAEQLTATYGVEVLDPREAVERATVVVVAVKPQDVDTVLAEISPAISSRHVVVSVAAGITIAHLETHLPDRTSVVRCMPNTPALVDEGMTAISPGAHAGAEQLDVTEALLASVGKVVRVPESQLDAVTALSGSGPAYFFLLVEAMIDAGVLLGLPRTVARELVVQTAVGSAVLLRESGEHPVQLREAVSSPAGTTVAAVRELEVHGVRAAVLAAAQAAARRAAELGASD
jgi:pyrroline-5-carboxylate reductase